MARTALMMLIAASFWMGPAISEAVATVVPALRLIHLGGKEDRSRVIYSGSDETDEQGNFNMAVNKYINGKELQTKSCLVRLVSSPHATCNIPTNFAGGLTGIHIPNQPPFYIATWSNINSAPSSTLLKEFKWILRVKRVRHAAGVGLRTGGFTPSKPGFSVKVSNSGQFCSKDFNKPINRVKECVIDEDHKNKALKEASYVKNHVIEGVIGVRPGKENLVGDNAVDKSLIDREIVEGGPLVEALIEESHVIVENAIVGSLVVQKIGSDGRPTFQSRLFNMSGNNLGTVMSKEDSMNELEKYRVEKGVFEGSSIQIIDGSDGNNDDLLLKTLKRPKRSLLKTKIESMELMGSFFAALSFMQQLVEKILEELKPRPSCIIYDRNFTWIGETAAKYQIPRIWLDGKNCLSLFCNHNLTKSNVHECLSHGAACTFSVPGLSDRIEFRQLPGSLNPWVSSTMKEQSEQAKQAEEGADGLIINSPVSLINGNNHEQAQRGNEGSLADGNQCLKWLDSWPPNSVIYACFGSLSRQTPMQFIELGLALEASERPFIWVIRGARGGYKKGEIEKWLKEEGFEDRIRGRGLSMRGWASQVLIYRTRRRRVLDTLRVELDARRDMRGLADDSMAIVLRAIHEREVGGADTESWRGVGVETAVQMGEEESGPL
ncbi:putative UDP-Glycosyltransferase superfamily protein [Hibiscus syriacus]|uniref:UDP-Glycosyltransferase superfamily protein n=1 Tax=Hibiscus syriacus TaxID=106335 RepID=A0A6A2YGR6_HIBSY|nr:putative UDP-Glycosyltransferase superfamily protein [Hibiscus syriacus]